MAPSPWIKVVIIVCLLGIVASLGLSLYHMVNDKGDSKRMVRALTVRISLSVALFLFLLVAWKLGWLQPHGFGK